ncbi:hypothetical protein [Rhizobium sp. SG2393]|uniref:hypothetical protein n=1 Tax=Rhizobium sp. SG2393 TaxID=3276279 RepID=UPI00366D4205
MNSSAEHPWIEGFTEPSWLRGKERHFRLWRTLVAEMIGAPVDYDYVRRPVTHADAANAALATIESLPFLEARILDPDWKQPTAEERAGFWDDLPEDPLWILVLLTVPGGMFRTRHAAAIADRLDELDDIIHHAGLGAHTHAHEAARAFFRQLAKADADVRVVGSYEPCGTVAVDPLTGLLVTA